MSSSQQLSDIATVLRRDSLEMTTAAGSGHPTSCLSCADLMAHLFFHEMTYDKENPYNPNNDEFVLSKGHAAPIYYSCLYRAGCIEEDLTTLRNLRSHLEGHPMPLSLPWVKVATGSLGHGLSIGVGQALAIKQQEKDSGVYVLLGDSELAEGSNYEALQLGAHYQLDNLVAIVDANRLGQRGETLVGHDVEQYKQRCEAFGWQAIVIDGHDFDDIQEAFAAAQNVDKPTAIIAKTFKGKGIRFIEDKEGWHGKALSEEELEKAFAEIPAVEMPTADIEEPPQDSCDYQPHQPTVNNYELGEKVQTRNAYGNALKRLAKEDPSVRVVDAEVSNSTRSAFVKEKTPDQFIEAFIAEQNMIGMAQGLSVRGFNVFASTFAAFISRAHDQIRMASLSTANLTICGSHAGVSIGQDGASQMGLADIALFRALRGSYVFYPSDAVSTEHMVNHAYLQEGIAYIRTTRPKTPVLYDNNESFPIGEFKVVRDSEHDQLVIAGAGITVHEALAAQEQLEEEGIHAAVVDIYCVKPFDAQQFAEYVRQHGSRLIVAEDHYPEGGIGEMLGSALEGTGIPLRTLAVTEIPHSGSQQAVLQACEIDRHAIAEAARSHIKG